MSKSVETTKTIFAAFARGDVPFILERLAADVEWEYGVCATAVPWYQNRRGRAGAIGFFESLAAVEFQRFTPKAFLHDEADDTVAVVVDADYTVRATGALVSYEDAIMLFRFNPAGEVARFAHRVDLTQAAVACA